mgnify:CR=1 FL=1
MKKFKLLFIALTLLVTSEAFAQNITVTGIVKDSSNETGVPFASIQLKGTMVGSSTDGDGIYSISVPADGVLIFSSIGYKDTEVAVAGIANLPANIILLAKIIELHIYALLEQAKNILLPVLHIDMADPDLPGRYAGSKQDVGRFDAVGGPRVDVDIDGCAGL